MPGTATLDKSIQLASSSSIEATYVDGGFLPLDEVKSSPEYTDLDKPAPRKNAKLKSGISASRLHKASPLFPRTGLPPRDKQDAEYSEYRAYLDRSLSYLKDQADYFGTPISADTGQLLKEIPIWLNDKVVWPNILHNGDGGLVFHWVADSLNLRIERYSSALFRIQTWHSLNILSEEGSSENSTFDPEYYLREVVPAMYRAIADRYHPDWKTFFEQRG